MTSDQSRPSDPAALAATVRALAQQAQRVMTDPDADPCEARDLARRIGRLQAQLHGRPTDDLARWLENLRAWAEERHREAACQTTAA